MKFEIVESPKYKKTRTKTKLCFILPAKKNWLVILFYGFLFLNWGIGGLFSVTMFVSEIFTIFSDDGIFFMKIFFILFMIFWIIMWAVSSFFVLVNILWQFKGSEELILTNKSITIKRSLFIISQSNHYDIKSIQDLRINPGKGQVLDFITQNTMAFLFLFKITTGKILFDYGAKSVYFGLALEEAEAKMILEDIKKLKSELFESTEKAEVINSETIVS